MNKGPEAAIAADDLSMLVRLQHTDTRFFFLDWDKAGRHTPEALRENLEASLAALKTDKVDMWYLYVCLPDSPSLSG